jgi:hypothetical protein
VAENTNAPTANASVAQNMNARTKNVSVAQNASSSTKNAPIAQSGNAPAPRSDRPPEAREPAARAPSSKPVHDPPDCAPKESSLVAEPSNQLPRRPTRLRRVARRLRSWLSQLVFSTFSRFLSCFCIGVAATLVWLSYSDAGKDTITAWCGRRTAASAGQKVSSPPEDLVPVSPDLLKTTSLNLAAVRESIDKLAAELSRLQTVEKLAAELTRLQLVANPDRRTSVPSPLVPAIPPAGKPPSPSRSSPAH